MNGLERLYYANGQRLAATELRLEQRYHVMVRRLLNRGLFTSGVVDGLEVVQDSARSVTVARGLALDPLGRELYVSAATPVQVPNQPPTNQQVGGYYLTVRYDEQQVNGDGDVCSSPGVIPTIVREQPILEWTEDWPDHTRAGLPGHDHDAAIVIGFATLTPACAIREVQTGFREYAHPTHTTQVSAVSFEGEKDIAKDNAKRLHFEISGGPPTSVVLALWGAKFSSLFYTEMAQHHHSTDSVSLDEKTVQLAQHQHGLPNHSHRTSGQQTTQSQNRGHRHNVRTEGTYESSTLGDYPHHPAGAIMTYEGSRSFLLPQPVTIPPAYHASGRDANTGASLTNTPYLSDQTVSHEHNFSVNLGHAVDDNGNPNLSATGNATSQPSASHTHQLKTPADTNSVGQPGAAVRSGSAYTYLEDLQVALDGTDITKKVKDFLGWAHLGTGAVDNQLNSDDGTGPIDLILDLGLSLEEGWHHLDLSVGAGGGKLLYNLYVR